MYIFSGASDRLCIKLLVVKDFIQQNFPSKDTQQFFAIGSSQVTPCTNQHFISSGNCDENHISFAVEHCMNICLVVSISMRQSEQQVSNWNPFFDKFPLIWRIFFASIHKKFLKLFGMAPNFLQGGWWLWYFRNQWHLYYWYLRGGGKLT